MMDISKALVDTSSIIGRAAGYGDVSRPNPTPSQSSLERQPKDGDKFQISDVRTSEFPPTTKKPNYASENPLEGIIDHYGPSEKVANETKSLPIFSNVEAARRSLVGDLDKLSKFSNEEVGGETLVNMPVADDDITKEMIPAFPDTVEIKIPGSEASSSIEQVAHSAPIAEVKPPALDKKDRIAKRVDKVFSEYIKTGSTFDPLELEKAKLDLKLGLRAYETKHLHGGELVPGEGFDDATVKIVHDLSQSKNPANAKEAKFWGYVAERFDHEHNPDILCSNQKRLSGVIAKATNSGKLDVVKANFLRLHEEAQETKLSPRVREYLQLAHDYFTSPEAAEAVASVAKRI